MATTLRAELSKNNKYWISKHRYYELKHFCLQYPQWKREYENIDDLLLRSTSIIEFSKDSKIPSDRNAKAMDTDPVLGKYILKAVTEDLSYTYLKSRLEIPCGKDMYYDRYRKFFWLLNRHK